jgi:hypothetical protein
MDRGRAACAIASTRCRWVSSLRLPAPKNKQVDRAGELTWRGLCLYDFARFDATGAHANPLVTALDLGLDRSKIHVPAPLGNVVRVGNLITELRTFAA